MMVLALDGEAWLNGMQKLEFMKTLVSDKDQKKMDKMLKQGYSPDEIVQHFLEDAEKKSGSQTLARKLEDLTRGKDLSEDEMLELMKNEMGEESRKKMEELMKQGHSKQEVIKMMMASGQLQDEETRDTAGTMQHIMTSKKKNIKMNQNDVKDMLEQRLDDEAKAKMKEMLEAGIPLKEVLDKFAAQLDPQEPELSEMEKKMKQLTEGRELSNYQIFELMKDQMDAESRKKMDEMVKNGCPLEEVIEHFMKKGKTKEQAQNDKSEVIRQLLEKQVDLTPEQKLELLRSELGSEDKTQMEKMLKQGCSIQEVIDHFVKRGQEQHTGDRTEFQTKIEELLAGKNLSDDEILALMRSQVDDETKASEAMMNPSTSTKSKPRSDTKKSSSARTKKPVVTSTSESSSEEETNISGMKLAPASKSMTKKSKPVSSSSPSETSSSDDEEEIKPSKTSKSLAKKYLKNLVRFTFIVINIATFGALSFYGYKSMSK